MKSAIFLIFFSFTEIIAATESLNNGETVINFAKKKLIQKLI
jgi:hypothetical protein